MKPDPLTEMLLDILFTPIEVLKGGPGSGFRGHKGRPGERGGSVAGDGGGGAAAAAGGVAEEGENPYGSGETYADSQVPVGTTVDDEGKALLEKLKSGELTNIRRLEGETTDIYVADLAGYGQVMIKPEQGVRSSYLREVIKAGRETQKEFAARIVNEAMRNPVEMPAMTVHDFGDMKGPDGKTLGRAMVMDHIEGLTLYGAEASNLGFRGTEIVHELPQWENMALFDAVVGNLDRHERNIMVDEFDNLVAIDHDLTFPVRNGTHGVEPIRGALRPNPELPIIGKPGQYGKSTPGSDIPADIMGRVITIDQRQDRLRGGENRRLELMSNDREAVSAALAKYVRPKEINAMWQRVDEMRATGDIYHLGEKTYSSQQTGQLIGGQQHERPQASTVATMIPKIPQPARAAAFIPVSQRGPTSMAHVRIKASGTMIVYFDTNGKEIGSTRVENGKAKSTGIGVWDDQMFVVEAGKPQVRLTPADGDKWLEGLLQTCRTEYCTAKLRKV
jgi:hypothetical protein